MRTLQAKGLTLSKDPRRGKVWLPGSSVRYGWIAGCDAEGAGEGGGEVRETDWRARVLTPLDDMTRNFVFVTQPDGSH